jgi:general secretion pathway protein G
MIMCGTLTQQKGRKPNGDGGRGERPTTPLAQYGLSLIELMITLAIMGIGLTIAMASYQGYTERVEAGNATADLETASSDIERFFSLNGELPDTLAEAGFTKLDPWGNSYEYLNFANVNGKGQFRKDRNLVPINTDYDLYSKGPDGASVAPLTAAASRDDIIRASNGAYIGPAADY